MQDILALKILIPAAIAIHEYFVHIQHHTDMLHMVPHRWTVLVHHCKGL
jgi:hypothetical protein